MSTKYRIDYLIINKDTGISEGTYFKTSCKDGNNIISLIIKYFNVKHKIFDKVQIMTSITGITMVMCIGCIYDCPGQRDHMGPDGCLGDY